MHSELNIRPAGFDANFTDHGDRRVAHSLIFTIGKRLRRCDRNGIARVYAHGIEVFNRADDDDVVFPVPHHLKLILFPPENRFFDKRLVYRREIKAARQNFKQFFPIERYAASGAAQRE